MAVDYVFLSTLIVIYRHFTLLLDKPLMRAEIYVAFDLGENFPLSLFIDQVCKPGKVGDNVVNWLKEITGIDYLGPDDGSVPMVCQTIIAKQGRQKFIKLRDIFEFFLNFFR